jgi:hypothetical protein
MKKTSLLILSLVMTAISCRKSDIANDIPYCIHKEIADNRNSTDWMIGSVEEYSFQNKTVYAFVPDGRIIADASTIIRDADCNTLCSVGGFGGPQVNICNGENFFQQATLIRTIWTKK